MYSSLNGLYRVKPSEYFSWSGHKTLSKYVLTTQKKSTSMAITVYENNMISVEYLFSDKNHHFFKMFTSNDFVVGYTSTSEEDLGEWFDRKLIKISSLLEEEEIL